MKQLGDYINFYHNAQFLDLKAEPDDNIIKLDSITSYSTAYDKNGNDIPFSELKPILRPLSDMTEDEKKEMMQQKHKYDTGNAMSHAVTDHAYRVKWAIEKDFDLFGLIDAGIAIDKSSMTITSAQ